MFGYYVRLRLRSGGRLLKELGIVRSVLLVGLLALAVAILCKVEASWILPVACLLVIGGYHQTRKDRDFLRRFTDDVPAFFLCEYLLLSLPFAVMAGIRGEWVIALCMPLMICPLPFVRPVRFRTTPVRLGFLYAGNMECLRMFRRMGWLYLIIKVYRHWDVCTAMYGWQRQACCFGALSSRVPIATCPIRICCRSLRVTVSCRGNYGRRMSGMHRSFPCLSG